MIIKYEFLNNELQEKAIQIFSEMEIVSSVAGDCIIVGYDQYDYTMQNQIQNKAPFLVYDGVNINLPPVTQWDAEQLIAQGYVPDDYDHRNYLKIIN